MFLVRMCLRVIGFGTRCCLHGLQMTFPYMSSHMYQTAAA